MLFWTGIFLIVLTVLKLKGRLRLSWLALVAVAILPALLIAGALVLTAMLMGQGG